jgi:hypothetical protein
MKLSSTIAIAAASLLGATEAVDFDFFDLEGWWEGGFLSVAADPRDPGSDVGLNMLLKCEEGDGFNGNNCEMVIRGPTGFSLCSLVTDPPIPKIPAGEGTVFSGNIGDYQFNADTGVAKFSILSAICEGTEITSFTVPPGITVPLEPTPVTLEMVPGASNKHVKSLKLTLVNPNGDADVSNFYKLAGGFKSS